MEDLGWESYLNNEELGVIFLVGCFFGIILK